ncbi:MAG: restriction endonuclease [Opitutaceae bacterium]|nr:restriction endonuclease [Opitutaceae bacterium]
MRAFHVIVVLTLLPAVSPAQVLPEGATPDEVLRVWGNPRSRSAAKGREIWVYPEHQAVFERGRLTSLVALPADGGNIAWQKNPAGAAPAAAASSGAPVRDRSPSAGSAPTRNGAEADAMLLKREGGKLTLRSPERSSPPAPIKKSGSGWRVFVTALFLVVAGGAGWVWWYWRRRRGVSAVAEEATIGAVTSPGESVSPVSGTARPFSTGSKPPTLVDWELTPELLGLLEWKRFELLVHRYFSAHGVRARTSLVGADGAFDLLLFRGRATRPFCYVQCRSWAGHCTDDRVIRELFTIMAENRVGEGIFVTTGTFTPAAEKFARQNRITLLAGEEFLARFNGLPHLVRTRILTDVTAGDYTTPSCPRCSVKLVLREGDAKVPSSWECQRYPRCRYTMEPRSSKTVGALRA